MWVCIATAAEGEEGREDAGKGEGGFGDRGEEFCDVGFAELGFALGEEGGGEGGALEGVGAVDEEVVGLVDGAVVVEVAVGPVGVGEVGSRSGRGWRSRRA